MSWTDAAVQIIEDTQRKRMRRAAKVDRNHAEIKKAFRQIGASVQDLSAVGKGCPDLLIGFRGINLLVEVKDGELVPSARELTADQKNWHAGWAGQASVAMSIADALELVAYLGCATSGSKQ